MLSLWALQSFYSSSQIKCPSCSCVAAHNCLSDCSLWYKWIKLHTGVVLLMNSCTQSWAWPQTWWTCIQRDTVSDSDSEHHGALMHLQFLIQFHFYIFSFATRGHVIWFYFFKEIIFLADLCRKKMFSLEFTQETADKKLNQLIIYIFFISLI